MGETKIIILGIIAVIAIIILVVLFQFVLTGGLLSDGPYDQPNLVNCNTLIGARMVEPQYTLDAGYQDMLTFTSRGSDCVFAEKSYRGYCCTEPAY